MKTQFTIFSATAILSAMIGCSTAPNNQTANTTSAVKPASQNSQTTSTTVSGGNSTLSVQQSNGGFNVSDGKQNSVAVKNNDADDADDSDDVDSDATVTDNKGNIVKTKTDNGTKKSTVQSGDNKVETVTENGKTKSSEISDGKGNIIKTKNGKTEIQSADGKKVIINITH